MSKPLKLFFVMAHYLLSLWTLYLMMSLVEMVESVFLDHKLDIVIFLTTFAFVEFIIFRIFEASQQSALISSLYILTCQEQTSSILQGISTGIVTRESEADSKESIQLCNRFAMSLLGEDGHWEEFKNEEGDVISPDNVI
mmetsp:Transcript_26379/g.40271  ORF Transcript_26379/g.40271 Transcript_26379/m.40271 type:complete len:140 (-) Transcript_26379:548-967(-)